MISTAALSTATGETLAYIAESVNHHAIVSMTNPDGVITFVNDRFCQISGYARDELVGQNHRILRSNQHSPEFYADLWQTIIRGDTWHGEICNCRKNGGFYWVESTILPFIDDDGSLVNIVSIRTDITAIMEAERALRALTKVTTSAADSDFFSRIVNDLGTSLNLRFAQIEGPIEPNAAYCSTLARFKSGHIVENDQFAVRGSPFEQLLEGNPVICGSRFPERFPEADWHNELGIESFIGVPLMASIDDCHLGYLCVMDNRPMSNVDTKADLLRVFALRVSVEIERRTSLRDLSHAHELLERSNEAARIGTWEADLSERRLTWSRMTQQIHEVDENYQCKFDDAAELYKTGDSRDTMKRVFSDAVTQGVSFDEELQIVTGKGKERWVRTIGVPQYSNGKCEQVYGLVQDIDMQKTIEADLDAARKEAESANRAKSEFLTKMSHELRTPMNSILGFSQLLETDSLLSDDQRSTVNEIITAGDHLLMLIDEVLDLAKIESGLLEVSSEPVAVGPAIRECLSIVSRLAEQDSITIDQTAIDESTVWADRVRLKQALLNLLSNAIKYNVRGGKVTIETHQIGNDTLRISVKDTGIGIAASHMEELFQPFKRLGAEITAIEGTGIGLALTRHIVEMMGGSVTAASEVGVGSTFTLELPMTSLHMKVESYAASGETQERDGTSRFASGTSERTILYIEDNPTNLKLVSRVLDSYKHLRLLTADRAELGIELALKHHPDVVLLDINLPGMSGYDVIDRLRETDALSGVPIVAVTANAMPDDIERGRQAGFTDYITKPLDLKRFKAILDRILAGMNT